MASPQWLTRGAELETVRREGKRIRTGALEVRALASPRRDGRLGIIVPRYKHTAVERNRLKRRLREILRREWRAPLFAGDPRDIVVRAAPAAYRADFAALRADLAQLAARLPAGSR